MDPVWADRDVRPVHNCGRITDLGTSGKPLPDLAEPDPDSGRDRVIICGGPALLEGSDGKLRIVIEKAFR